MNRAWVLVVALGAACAPAAPPPSLDAIAEGYVKAALQLAQHNPLLIERWNGPSAWQPGARTPVQPIVDRIDSLLRDLDRVPSPDPDRLSYLLAQLKALHVAGERLLGQAMRFDEEAQQSLGVTTPPIDEAALAAARESLAIQLPGRGTLANRLSAFKKTFAVPPSRAKDVMRRALDVCRAATVASLPLPQDEGVELTFDATSDLDGSAEYLGHHHTRIRINPNGALDLSRALHLACHEGYPGHHVQFILLDDYLSRHRDRHELELVPAFGRHLLVAEGAAEAATGAALPVLDRQRVYREELFPAAGLPLADVKRLTEVEELVGALEPIIADTVRQYLDNSLTQVKAIERLQGEALVPDPESLLAYAERRRVNVLAYPAGRVLLQRMMATEGLTGLKRLFGERPFTLP